MEATDADGPGVNSLVSYDKEGEDANKFSVDKDTGVVTVAAGAVLDREADQTLELIITAEDAGDRASSITMTITLEDENDNIPFFIPKFGYALSVPEDTEVGTVLTVAVSLPLPLYQLIPVFLLRRRQWIPTWQETSSSLQTLHHLQTSFPTSPSTGICLA